ncbi:hypothetical protein A3D03_05205 [Candidatus Gottesmanbacteria bacterium RIFCSPHIGHO2_02_FULL_40_13]|uniref:Beta-xylosidase C-terminal Concanavalin A-like domain-containing protein n=1 Tax=Candidatus Gottesmanbacteria bacterium RIFCSPHIGHO2_02_FULL_40_13 TaxID=1798384 RepID=A0A1F6A8L8_9BACT|nr:MAG: hypothetical protein A3D03_05205 [Candidatus Gottesmanbacteria bacterium RIFCSPHIGHO2_02_FULL_40_13]
MESLFSKYSQKYIPIILVIGVVLIGGYMLIRKGVVSLPNESSKSNLIDVKKTSIVELLFSGKEYKLSYKDIDPASLVDIALYDKTEQWQGSGSIEDDVTFGGNVMSMIDRDRQKSSATLLKNIDLSGVDNVKFIVNYKSDPDNVEALNLYFSNKDNTSFFRFPITNLKAGMNYFSIPKNRFFLVEGQEVEVSKTETRAADKGKIGWDKIERVELELISRPGSKIFADVSWIRSEKEDMFTPDWNWDGLEHFLNLYHTQDGKLALNIRNVGRSIATLRRVGSVKDFTFSTKMTSIKEGFVGLFFRGDYKTGLGYFLSIGGIRTSDWTLSKTYLEGLQAKTLLLLKGQLANFEFSKDQPFWLKVSVKGDNITTYFSLDGTNYTKLGEVIDNSISSGGVGIHSAGGAAIFDDFELSLK